MILTHQSLAKKKWCWCHGSRGKINLCYIYFERKGEDFDISQIDASLTPTPTPFFSQYGHFKVWFSNLYYKLLPTF
jgi:hypothetical protein